MTILSFTSVTYTSGTSALFTNLTWSVPSKACTVVMGPSGGGKSTLLRLAAGLIPPDSGKI